MEKTQAYTGALMISIIYFFFNSFLLPHGLLYTLFLTPFFYWYLIKNKRKQPVLKFFLFFGPFACIHLLLGVDILSFVKSSTLLFATYIFTYAFHTLLLKKFALNKSFKQLLLINSAFVLLAIVLFFTPCIEWLWTIRPLTIEIRDTPRLELLTYEPSYYSTLLVPIVVFYCLKFFFEKHTASKTILYLSLIFIPLILSFSLGVMSCLVITAGLLFLRYARRFIRKKIVFYSLSSLVVISVSSLLLLLIFYPDNLLFERLVDLFTGKDISAKGRTTHGYHLSVLVAKTKSLWFGVGAGQIKIMGDSVVRNYYNYQVDDIPIIRIPSSIGETMGTFGIVGLALRLVVQFYLFAKTKVNTNVYRLFIFVYIFIYQFTGSYLTNLAEYVLWVLAFTPVFEQFNFDRILRTSAPLGELNPAPINKAESGSNSQTKSGSDR